MKVEIKVKIAPSYNVAYMIHYGPYTGQNMWRSEFNQLAKWSKKRRLRTGKWIMYFIDKWSEKTQMKRRSVAAIEINRNAKPEGEIQIMRIPGQKVASVIFDPDKVSEELVYHGLEGWLESSSYNPAARSRELYDGNPWTEPRAWANCEAQVPLKRK